MSCNHKYSDRRICRQKQYTTDTSALTSEYDSESPYYQESDRFISDNHNSQQKSAHCRKDEHVLNLDKGIWPHRSQNTKCPVYVHQMKMQKNYSQSDTYNKSYPHNYHCSKWDYYDDRTHFMKNKFDQLKINTESESKKPKTTCTRTPCPVHHCCKGKKQQTASKEEPTKPVNEEVINKLEETYWAKWRPPCKQHGRKADSGETKKIRTEEDYRKRKACCGSERNLSGRCCPDCFKYLPDDGKDVKCLHKRTSTKESKSSDFVKSEIDESDSAYEDDDQHITDIAEDYDCPTSYPGKVEMEKAKNENVNSHIEELLEGIVNNVENDCIAVNDCPSTCIYKKYANGQPDITLEGEDVEEQLKITQYNSKLSKSESPKAIGKAIIDTSNLADPYTETRMPRHWVTVEDPNQEKDRQDPDIRTDKEILQIITTPGTANVAPAVDAQSSKLKSEETEISGKTANTLVSEKAPEGPEGPENPLTLKHTDSFILNSIKQDSLEGKPHYKQPTAIKLSNINRVKGHSYPLKPILKKDKQHSPRNALNSPKRVPLNGPTGVKPLAPHHKPPKKH